MRKYREMQNIEFLFDLLTLSFLATFAASFIGHQYYQGMSQFNSSVRLLLLKLALACTVYY